MPEKRQSELTVVMRAKDLCRYIMTITQKCPKQFRFIFTTRIQNLSLDIIEHIYRANDTFVANGPDKQLNYKRRLNFQHEALTELRLLAYFAQVALEEKAILPKHYEQISMQSVDCMNMIGAWILSDKKRFGYG
ncbi:MAG: four helix bundle protein [Oscillospiraceae bacterium]|jgi:hypothetical protein|nr:four helix bundle protein [Oscillospiraceae bacterium]